MNRFSALLLVLAVPTASRADWGLELIRMTCIPESRYFEFEYKSVSGPDVLIGGAEFDEEKRVQPLQAWRGHGLYEPANLKYECRLPESLYQIVSHQPPVQARGMCGGAPRITLSLLRNDDPILSQVLFGYDCFGEPTVVRVEIPDGLEGWGERAMKLCVAKNTDSPLQCKFLSETDSDISKAVPITQDEIRTYVSEKER